MIWPKSGPSLTAAALGSSPKFLIRTTLILAAVVIALTLVSLRYPPRLGFDFARLLSSWEHFRRTGEFNQIAAPDPADISRDVTRVVTWWSPGSAVATGIFEFAGLPIGLGMSFWLGAATIAQLWGLRTLYSRLGFGDSTIGLALIVAVLGWHSLYSFRLFQGGDLFANALFPWVCLAILRIPQNAIAAALVTGALVVLGGFIKLSVLITILAFALASVVAVTPPRSNFFQGVWRHSWPLVLGGVLGWASLDFLLLSKGVNPTNSWAVEYTAGTLLHSIGMAIILPLWSVFSLVSVSGRLLDAVGVRHLEANPGLLMVAALACGFVYRAVWRSLGSRPTRILIFGFTTVFVLIFAKFYFTAAAISYEDRHFRPAGLLLLPAIVECAEQGASRMLRAGLWFLLGIGAVWGPASYLWNLYDLIRCDNLSAGRYSLAILPAAVEQKLRRLDSTLTTGNNLLLVASVEAELAIVRNRTATVALNDVPNQLRGRVDNLVVLLPEQTPAAPWLGRFSDYQEHEWNRYSVAGWAFFWHGRQIRLPIEYP